MIRPRTFTAQADALRWARLGGVALHVGPEYTLYADASAAQKSEALGWSRFWAGKAGVTFPVFKDRGTFAESLPLTEDQARFVEGQSLNGPTLTAHLPTTVLFFTGTRKGMSLDQRDALTLWLFERNVVIAHHGCCVGADEELHNILAAFRESDSKREPFITGWPAEVGPELSCFGRIRLDDDRVRQAPLTRNRMMSECAAGMIASGKPFDVVCVACPLEDEPPESGRGGTWHAVRQFKAKNVPTTIITPSGTMRHE